LKLILVLALLATAGFAQAQSTHATLHVRSVHKETPAENGGDHYHAIFEHTVVMAPSAIESTV
jgi:uncharacterized protein (DUF58 family)